LPVSVVLYNTLYLLYIDFARPFFGFSGKSVPIFNAFNVHASTDGAFGIAGSAFGLVNAHE
jgi:hypothetical protein